MNTMHLICNAHLDPVWLWEWEEGAAEALSTFRVAADFCEEYDGFIFNHNEVILYEWVEEYEPELFERIRRLVKEGRWHIMGGWYLQPDCNMPSGESFVRQIQAGRRYFDEKFGVRPTTAINVDPFGHTRGLVQILAKSGYDSYLFCRPWQCDCPLPDDLFRWEGYDGSRILGRRMADHYNSPRGRAVEKIEKRLREHPRKGDDMLLWGIGNHGGGPSRIDLERIGEFMGQADVEVLHSTPEAYFARAAAETEPPLHRGDLNSWAPGCYTSQIRIKQKHRELENRLYSAEKMVTPLALAGEMDYPAPALERAQKNLLTLEFHDILPGSSIQPGEEMGLNLAASGLDELDRVRARAFFKLTRNQPKAAEGEYPVFVYNPHPYPLEGVFSCEFNLADQSWKGGSPVPSLTCRGERVPCQWEKELSNLNLDWRMKLVFRGRLNPSGLTRFDCAIDFIDPEGGSKDGKSPPVKTVSVASARQKIGINRETGLMDSWVVDGREMLTGGGCSPVVFDDDADPWGSRVSRFNERLGAFGLLDGKGAARFSGRSGEEPAVKVIEDGPVRTVVEALFGRGDSFICQRYLIPAEGIGFDLEMEVHWQEKDRMLKLALPTVLEGAEFRGETAYGRETFREEGKELVAQKWNGLFESSGGDAVAVLNDGTYGCSFEGGTVYQSLLRSSAYSALTLEDRPLLVKDRFIPRIDQGERRYRFRFLAGKADGLERSVGREAQAFNEALYLLSFFPAGRRVEGEEGAAPGLRLEGDESVLLMAMKKSEDGSGVVLRLFESSGRESSARLVWPVLPGGRFDLTLAPFEVKTLLICNGRVIETDLLE